MDPRDPYQNYSCNSTLVYVITELKNMQSIDRDGVLCYPFPRWKCRQIEGFAYCIKQPATDPKTEPRYLSVLAQCLASRLPFCLSFLCLRNSLRNPSLGESEARYNKLALLASLLESVRKKISKTKRCILIGLVAPESDLLNQQLWGQGIKFLIVLVLSTATSSCLLQWDSWHSCTATFTCMPNRDMWLCVPQRSALCYLPKYWGSPHFWVLLLHPEGPNLFPVAHSNLLFRKRFLFPHFFYKGPFKWLHFSYQSPAGSTSAGINHWDTPHFTGLPLATELLQNRSSILATCIVTICHENCLHFGCPSIGKLVSIIDKIYAYKHHNPDKAFRGAQVILASVWSQSAYQRKICFSLSRPPEIHIVTQCLDRLTKWGWRNSM